MGRIPHLFTLGEFWSLAAFETKGRKLRPFVFLSSLAQDLFAVVAKNCMAGEEIIVADLISIFRYFS